MNGSIKIVYASHLSSHTVTHVTDNNTEETAMGRLSDAMERVTVRTIERQNGLPDLRVAVYNGRRIEHDCMDVVMTLLNCACSVTRDDRGPGWEIYAGLNMEADQASQAPLDFQKIGFDTYNVFAIKGRSMWTHNLTIETALSMVTKCVV